MMSTMVNRSNISQFKRVIAQEELGWVLENNKKETKNLCNGLPVLMRNKLGELALIHHDGSMRPVRNERSLLSLTDKPGTLFTQEENYLREIQSICHPVGMR